MEFGFQKKSDGSLKTLKTSSAPLKEMQLNRDYIKLYEIASIKVMTYPTFIVTLFYASKHAIKLRVSLDETCIILP